METAYNIKSELPDTVADYIKEQPQNREDQVPINRAKITKNEDLTTCSRRSIKRRKKIKPPTTNSKTTNSPTTNSPEQKYQHREEHQLSGYNKRQILNYLKQHGSSKRNFENALGTFKVRKDIALEFFNKHVEDAQENVYQECDSLSFENISAWLSLFKSWQLPEQCFYELAVVMHEITKNEAQPAPSELSGIDLKSIYKFLGNALLGLPQPELSAETAEFLADEFEMLINDANTDAADIETKDLKQQLQNSEPLPSADGNLKQKISLDPLQLEDKI